MTPEALADHIVQAGKKVLADGGHPLALFDLDATLFDNGPRTWQILLEYAEASQHQELRRALDGLPRKSLPYLLEDVLALGGVDDPEVVQKATAFWAKRFFTDDYQRYDEPTPGAVAFVRKVFDAGITVVYLTGRDSPGMLVGCCASLRQHGFPVGVPHTAVVLKPDFETADAVFKKDAVRFLDSMGDAVAAFDNEPKNCNLFLEAWPQSKVVFIDTHHAPGAPPLDDGIITITEFS
jgi:hypothetical protein